MYHLLTDYVPLCNLLKYSFNQEQLLAQALTRKSGLLEGKQAKSIGQNERLEFLGDSVLRAVIDDILIELYPSYDEAQLSTIRDQWVAKEGFLYKAAEKINLASFIIMGYGERINCRGPGRKKILSDTMEAIIGAVFLDSERNYATVKQFIGLHSGLAPLLQAHRNKQLFEAVKVLDLAKVKYWLNQEADPNALHEFKYVISCPCCISDGLPRWTEIGSMAHQGTALDLAIRRLKGFNKDTLAIVKALLAHGADPNNKGTFRHTVLHEAMVYYPKGWEACYHSLFTDLISLLCEYGADPNLRCPAIHCDNGKMCEQGYTPIELAILTADVEKVKALLCSGAKPNLLNNKGQTALHLACIYYELYVKQAHASSAQRSDFIYSKKEHLTIFTTIINTLIRFGVNALIRDNDHKLPADYTDALELKTLLSAVAIKANTNCGNSFTKDRCYEANQFTFLSQPDNEPAHHSFEDSRAKRGI